MWPTIIEKQTQEQKKVLLGNWTCVLEKAITNLHKCLWLGLVEDLDNGFEMLRYQTGLNVTTEHINVNSEDYQKPSKAEREKLKTLMPMDIYLYEYAKQLHDYRHRMFTDQKQQLKQQTQTKQRELSLTLPGVLDGCKGYSKLYECYLFDDLFAL